MELTLSSMQMLLVWSLTEIDEEEPDKVWLYIWFSLTFKTELTEESVV